MDISDFVGAKGAVGRALSLSERVRRMFFGAYGTTYASLGGSSGAAVARASAAGLTCKVIDFSTPEDGPQYAFLFAPRSVARVWICFSGCGCLALEFADFLFPAASGGASLGANSAFLLIEYPGHGESAGVPTPESVLRVSCAAASAAAAHLGTARDDFLDAASVLGYSLGAAAAVDFAAAAAVGGRVVLVSPFTTSQCVARNVTSCLIRPLIPFAPLRAVPSYDTVALLRDFLSLQPPERSIAAAVFHGEDDAVCPFAASEAAFTAAEFSGSVAFFAFKGAGHEILGSQRDKIVKVMALLVSSE